MALSNEDLARRIAAGRELRGMGQQEVGASMQAEGYGKHDIARIERQDENAPRFHPGRRATLAKILDLPEAWFVADDEDFFTAEAPSPPATGGDAGEMGKRVRTARTWAGLGQKELGKALGISEMSVRRIESGSDLSEPEQWAIAEITGVPRWFITEGFPAEPPSADEIRDRLERIEALLIEDEGSAIAGFEEAIDEAADSADATRDTGDASKERNRGARRRHV